MIRKNLFLTILSLLMYSVLYAQQCPQLVWSDEFNGSSLDESKWSYQIGDGCKEGVCGWGNNEEQSYQEANVTVSNGLLTITAKKERIRGKKYTSGRIRTLGNAAFRYGRIEARIKIPQGQGMWPAFWMLPTDEAYGGWPQSGEIDIMENVGYEPDKVHGTIHYGDPYPNNQNQGSSFKLHNGIFADDFHTFAIEWEPTEIRWYVDDILFSTKTASDVSPFNWPFDQDFYLLLNIAVGGNWPGSPDNSTNFPQTMEVDYVRIYDQSQPTLEGLRIVANQAQGTVFQLNNVPGSANINWTVPQGASVVSGQGTSQVTIDWGNTGGTVTATISSSCSFSSLSMDVIVEPPFAKAIVLENFDQPANVSLSSATGSLQTVSNPSPSSLNSSANSGKYSRSGADQYDVIAYTTSAVTDGSELETNQKKFYIDVYTSAPVGSTVLLQMENSSTASATNYPAGRHSRYQAVTTTQNQWERLVFSYLDSPDGSTPDNSIDQLILLFAPNTFTSDVYYFDNLDIYSAQTAGPSGARLANTVEEGRKTEVPEIGIYPQPIGGKLTIRLAEKGSAVLKIMDMSGRIHFEKRVELEGKFLEVNTSELSAGMYFLLIEQNGQVTKHKLIKD